MQFSRERALTLAIATSCFGLAALLRKIAVDSHHPVQYQVVANVVGMCLVPVYFTLGRAMNVQWTPAGVWLTVAGTLVASFGGLMLGYALKAGNDTGVVTTLSSLSPSHHDGFELLLARGKANVDQRGGVRFDARRRCSHLFKRVAMKHKVKSYSYLRDDFVGHLASKIREHVEAFVTKRSKELKVGRVVVTTGFVQFHADGKMALSDDPNIVRLNMTFIGAGALMLVLEFGEHLKRERMYVLDLQTGKTGGGSTRKR